MQAIKGMDDNTLNIHLSSLCNSLTDAATDAIKVCIISSCMFCHAARALGVLEPVLQ